MNKLIIGLTLLLLAGCTQIGLYEKDTNIPGGKWYGSQPVGGDIQIADTNALYNLYIVLRHTDAYKYNNIWLNVGMQPPGDSMYFQRVNLQLGSDASGWEGTGMNDIWEVRKALNNAPRRFIKAGPYHFTISQIMRDEPLHNVLSAGMRIEKVGELPQ